MDPFGSPPRGAFSGASFGSYWSPLRGTSRAAKARLAAPPSPLRGPTAELFASRLPLSSSSTDAPRAAEDPLSATSVYDAIAKAERRAREAERWAKDTVADVRNELSQQRQAMDESRRMATELSAVASAEASHRAQSLGQERYRALTDAEQRVLELQSAAIQAVNDAREDALSRISKFSAAVGSTASLTTAADANSQALAAASQNAVQPGVGPLENSAVDMLHAAAAAGRASTVLQYLEKENANVLDGRGRTPLWLAASRGHSAVVVVLAENGASPGLACNGMTPAYSAAGLGHTHVLLALSQLGADMEKPDVNGISPVSIAGHQGHLGAVRLLVNLGVDLEAASDNGATPFWSACRAGHLEVAKLLASRGVDVRAPARNQTPREIASASGHATVVKFIDSYTAGSEVATASTTGEAAKTSGALAGQQQKPQLASQVASPRLPEPSPQAADPATVSPDAVPQSSTAMMQSHGPAVVSTQPDDSEDPIIDDLLSTQQQLQMQLAQQQHQLQLMQQRVEQQQQLHEQQLQHQKLLHEQREMQYQEDKARLEQEQRAMLEQEALSASETRPRAHPARSAEVMQAAAEPELTTAASQQLQQLIMQEQLLVLMEHRRAGIFGKPPEPEPEQARVHSQPQPSADQPQTPNTAALKQLLGSMEFAKGELACLKDSELAHRQGLTPHKSTERSAHGSPASHLQAQHAERTAATQYSPPHRTSSAGTQWSPPPETTAKHAQGPTAHAKLEVPAVQGGVDSGSPEKWRQPRPSSAPVVRVPSTAAPVTDRKVPVAVEAWTQDSSISVGANSSGEDRDTPDHTVDIAAQPMAEESHPTDARWARIVTGDLADMVLQDATMQNDLGTADLCESEITEKQESKELESGHSPDSSLKSRALSSTAPAFLTEVTDHDHTDPTLGVSQAPSNRAVKQAQGISESASPPTAATKIPDVPTVGAIAKQTGSHKPLNDESAQQHFSMVKDAPATSEPAPISATATATPLTVGAEAKQISTQKPLNQAISLEMREAVASMQRVASAVSDKFIDAKSSSALAQALEQVLRSDTNEAAASHVNTCTACTQELVKELQTANQEAQAQAANASKTTSTDAELNAVRQKLAAAMESLKSRVSMREADEAAAAALRTEGVEIQPDISDAQLRDQLQRELDDAIVEAQEKAVKAVTAAQSQANEHETARRAAEQALEEAKHEAEAGGRSLVTATQASLRTAQQEAQKAEEAAEHSVSQTTEQAEELDRLKQNLAVAQQDNMARQAEQTRIENDLKFERTKLALEEAQAKYETTTAQLEEIKKMVQRSKEEKQARAQDKEKLDASATLASETQQKAHLAEMDSLRQRLQDEGDRACNALKQTSKADIAAANRARDDANQRLNNAETQLRAVKMDFDATKARVEKEDRAARDASQRSQAAKLAESISAATARREDAERLAIQYEKQLRGVENEAKVATEDVANMEYQISTAQEAAHAQREEKQVAAEALETLRGQFQQITAELELSFDDMRSSRNPQDRHAEIQQLREDEMEARQEILEFEEELRGISVQNDQLQRKVQNIQRELGATQALAGGVGRGIGGGMGGMGGGVLMDARQAAAQQNASAAAMGGGGGPAGRGIEGNPGARPRPSSGGVDYTKPLERPAREGGSRRNVPPQASGPAPKPQRQGGTTGNTGRSGRTVEEVLCVGSRWKGHIDRDGRKVMYSLKVTREEKGGKKTGGLGSLVGMHTLLTSNNVVTINPLPDIPGLVRIAEKAKGGIECIGEVNPEEGTIDGMIRIAGSECAFQLSVLK